MLQDFAWFVIGEDHYCAELELAELHVVVRGRIVGAWWSFQGANSMLIVTVGQA